MDQGGDDVRWGVQRRLEFIDFRLFWDGRFNRRDLMTTFGISAPQASADIALYTARAPRNLVYVAGQKAFVRTPEYEPALMTASAERYLLQLVAIENHWMSRGDTWFEEQPPIESVTLLRKRTDARILLHILDAINRRTRLEIEYSSISGVPEPRRSIEPHALFHALGRWYVRAWSHDHRDFRDYNLFRVATAQDAGAASSSPELDFEWMHRIDLELIPNPALAANQQAALAAEYGMTDGRLVVTLRLNQTFYLMTEHNLDVEPGILPPAKQQLILVNRDDVVAARKAARTFSIEAVARASQ